MAFHLNASMPLCPLLCQIWELFLPSIGVKVSGHYCWDVLLSPFIFMCIFVRISVYFVCLGLVIGIVFYSVPCIYFILFFCVLGLHNIDFICSTCIVSGQSALMHFNK